MTMRLAPRAALTATALALVALAGCFGPEETPIDHAGIESAIAADAAPSLALEHDAEDGHLQGALHRGAMNLELVGYANGVDDSGDPDRIPAGGSYNELAIHDGVAYLVGTSADGTWGGFSILSLEDPETPRFLGHWAGQPGSDIEVAPEGDLVYVATQRNSVQQLAGGAQANPAPRDNLPRGIHVVSVEDKRNPVQVGFVPLPTNGPHTITPFRHENGSDYLLACTYDLVTDPVSGAIAGAVPVTQRLVVFLVQRNDDLPLPVGAALGPVSLLPVAQYQVVGNAPAGKLWFPHDATVQVHPMDGRTLITVAYWDQGVRILDFTTPPAVGLPDASQTPILQEVGRFTDFSPSAYNNIHLAKAFPSDVAGLHVTVAEPEIIDAPEETGQVTFLDTTDPSAPQRLGWWALGDLAPDLAVRGLDFSPHNFDTWDTQVGGRERHFLALAHYHAGVWLIDVSDEALLKEPRAVAYAMTGAPFGNARTDSPVLSPNVWSVLEEGGLLYASDEATGLHVFRYTGP